MKTVHSVLRDKQRRQLLKTESLPLNQQYIPFGGKRFFALKGVRPMSRAGKPPSPFFMCKNLPGIYLSSQETYQQLLIKPRRHNCLTVFHFFFQFQLHLETSAKKDLYATASPSTPTLSLTTAPAKTPQIFLRDIIPCHTRIITRLMETPTTGWRNSWT